MRTSNKILAAFFLVVFLVPVLVVMAFKSKIRNDDFIPAKIQDGWGTSSRGRNIGAFRVLKLVAPEGRTLNCDINHADSMFYNYGNNGHGDSLRVYHQNDTLVMEYVRLKDDVQSIHDAAIDVSVYLPVIEELIIENAEVAIKTVDTTKAGDLMVDMRGASTIKIGINEIYESRTLSAYKYGVLRLVAVNGAILLGSTVKIDQLNVDAKGKSSITIDEATTIGSIQGNISDSTSVQGSWRYMKKLASAN